MWVGWVGATQGNQQWVYHDREQVGFLRCPWGSGQRTCVGNWMSPASFALLHLYTKILAYRTRGIVRGHVVHC